MSKARKKHSMKARHAVMSRIATRGLYVVMIGGKGCKIWDEKVNKFINPSKILEAAICDVAHKWSILVSVFCESDREQYIKSEIIEAAVPYLQSSLAEYATEKHNEVVKSSNPKHFFGCGWVASPEGVDVSEEFAGKLFDAAGAWETKHEPIQFN